jgi:hypothetical protein
MVGEGQHDDLDSGKIDLTPEIIVGGVIPMPGFGLKSVEQRDEPVIDGVGLAGLDGSTQPVAMNRRCIASARHFRRRVPL